MLLKEVVESIFQSEEERDKGCNGVYEEQNNTSQREYDKQL